MGGEKGGLGVGGVRELGVATVSEDVECSSEAVVKRDGANQRTAAFHTRIIETINGIRFVHGPGCSILWYLPSLIISD